MMDVARGAHPVRGKGSAHPHSVASLRSFFQPDSGGLQAAWKEIRMPARPLPDRPNLSQYKKQAKELLKALRSADADAVARVRARHPRLGATASASADLRALRSSLA